MKARWTWRMTLLMFGIALPGATTPALTGRYVLSQRTVVRTSIPILPDLSTETWSVGILDLTADTHELVGKGNLCSIEMRSSSSLVRTELPPAFQRLLSELRLQAQLKPHAGGFLLEESPRVLVLGAKLADPAHETLPTDASDPRVVDQDRDGKPGVTVAVRGIVNGEVYVVQRGATSLRGQSDAQGFHGAVRFQSEDVVVGASRSALTRRTKARPDLARSTFVLRKVTPNFGCADAEVLAARMHPE